MGGKAQARGLGACDSIRPRKDHEQVLRTCLRSRRGRGREKSAALQILAIATAYGCGLRLAAHSNPHPAHLTPRSQTRSKSAGRHERLTGWRHAVAERTGAALGLAFQGGDDILNVTTDAATLGRTAGKLTYAQALTPTPFKVLLKGGL